ncbi:MAG: nucleotidyltransferase domain-containing protein [Thermomicrobiales bacterium]|nr:nucleotidyltransferase domain-containing protein [Thermomicrobiales bacterium]
MIDLITDNLDAIGELCRTYGVRKLEVFGSAATGEFDPETSDIDLIYEFSDVSPGLVKRFLDFADALEALFGRHVDLIEDQPFENPYFRYSVRKSRKVIFGPTDGEAAV